MDKKGQKAYNTLTTMLCCTVLYYPILYYTTVHYTNTRLWPPHPPMPLFNEIITHLGPKRTGPKSAAIEHMGSPVCMASTHLTATSPSMLGGIPKRVCVRSWIWRYRSITYTNSGSSRKWTGRRASGENPWASKKTNVKSKKKLQSAEPSQNLSNNSLNK
jgi:hypothetical protein